MKFKFAFFIYLILNISYGQALIQGTVVDIETNQPLAFANLSIKNASRQMMSDVNGRFTFANISNNSIIVCSYVGFEKGEFKVDEKNSKRIVIKLQPSHNELPEVVVNATDYFANQIMAKVIANKEKNNPEQLKSFQYTSYNKVICDYKSLTGNKNDSVNFRRKLKGSHFFMMESVTEKKFLKPDLSKELVIATKVSGFKNPSFATIATDFQPFSFYNDNIKFFNVTYLNPISKGSLKKYKFQLEDTLTNGKDTVYIISYKPRHHKNFDGLKGLLYINSKKYAVQNVIASPAEVGKIDIKIQQRYAFIDDAYWFPEQLNFAIQFNDYPNKNTPMVLDGKTYISDIKLNLPFDKKQFSNKAIILEEDSATKDSVFWEKHRVESLTSAEKKTYKVIDSIGSKMNFDYYLTFLEKIMQNRFPLKYIDIDLSKTFLYNKYENLRIGSGFYTNDAIFKKMSLRGFLGYGIKDEQLKYGGEFVVNVSKINEFNLGIHFQNNLIETGGYGANISHDDLFNYRRFIGYRYDQINEVGISIHFRSFNYFLWDVRFNKTNTDPRYFYEFNNGSQSFSSYKNSSIDLKLRFAYKEKFIDSFHQNLSTGTQYPIVFVSYSKGLKNLFQGNLNYNKIELAAKQSFYTRNIGATTYRLEVGFIDSSIPYGLLFTGEGSYDESIPLIMKNTFQTMTPYEFLSDKYVNLFLSHNFGGLLFKTNKFQPILSWHNNISWGMLSKPTYQRFVEFKTKTNIFFETGLQFDNLLKANYLNLADIGFGAGAYFRYGYYSNPEFKDNIAFKFTLNLSIK